jgi:chorismate lyase/3-hydroxybenzoate synthase
MALGRLFTLKRPLPLISPVIMSSPFSVQYLTPAEFSALACKDRVPLLGVIGYGAPRPDFLPAACPFVQADLAPLGGRSIFEVWTAHSSTIRYNESGPIRSARSEDIVFGMTQLDQVDGMPLQNAVSQAYCAIFDSLTAAGFEAPIRFWTYLPKITDDENGMERYRRFNIGRSDAFTDRLLLPVPPVASAVGGQSGAPIIYFLAAKKPATPIENPRQVSAYHYPPAYGPSSPKFSRASVFESGGARTLLVAGTASIVGHQSLHPNDPEAQLAETLENIAALISEAGPGDFMPRQAHWVLKAYLRDPAYLDIVQAGIDRMFGPQARRLYLHAHICRPELLLEIEAICPSLSC